MIVVAAALVAMKVYFGRAVSEKYRQTAELFGGGEQYDKENTTEVNTDEPGLDITSPVIAPDTCPNIVARIAEMRKEIDGYSVPPDDEHPDGHVKGLIEKAAHLEAQAKEIRDKLTSAMPGQGLDQTQLLEQAAQNMEEQARGYREKAAQKEDYIVQLKIEFPSCFEPAQ